MNKIVITIVVVLVAIVGGYFLLKGGYQSPAPIAPEVPALQVQFTEEELEEAETSSVKEFTVIGTEYSFSPSNINVKAGEQVKITFKNNGKAPHNLIIAGLEIGTKTIGRGQTDVIEFTAPSSGTYAFFCSVSGHRAAGMEGSLKAQ